MAACLCYVCLSVCLSLCQRVSVSFLSVWQCVSPPVSVSVYLCLCLSTSMGLSVHMSVSVYLCPFVYLYVCLCVNCPCVWLCLSVIVCMSVWLTVCVCLVCAPIHLSCRSRWSRLIDVISPYCWTRVINTISNVFVRKVTVSARPAVRRSLSRTLLEIHRCNAEPSEFVNFTVCPCKFYRKTYRRTTEETLSQLLTVFWRWHLVVWSIAFSIHFRRSFP